MKLRVATFLIITASCGSNVIRPNAQIKTDVPVSSKKQEQSSVHKEIVKQSKAAKNKRAAESKIKKVNSIAVVIYTDTTPIVITELDFKRHSLDGRERSRQEVILDHLMYYEATVSYKMSVPEELVRKHLLSIKEEHGLSEDQISQLFMREGYTLEEGKQQLRMSYAIQSLIQQFITNRLVVTEDEIQNFYKKNPLREKAAYKIQKGFIDKDAITADQVKELTDDGLYYEKVEWAHPYWLEEDEIASSRNFITKMQPGQIHAISADDKYEVFMLVKRKKAHTKTLNEARVEIANVLRMPKYEKMLTEFHNNLLNKYEIVYMDGEKA